MSKASKMSGARYQLSGRVVHGQHYGRILGFPTANIDRRQYIRDGLKVKLGIWAGQALFHIKAKKQNHKAAVVIGPVDKKGLPKIEAHLLNFKGNLYGKRLTLHLGKYLRPFKKFRNEQELRSQIQKDIKRIK